MLPFFRRSPQSHQKRDNDSTNNENRLVPFSPPNVARLPSPNATISFSAGNLLVTVIAEETSLQNQRHRAKSSNELYDLRVKEFKEWCDRIFCNDDLTTRYTVTEENLITFLQMCVIGRKSKNAPDQEISLSSILAYRNAIVDLYKTQRSQKLNRQPHPGEGKNINNLLKSVKIDKSDHMKGSMKIVDAPISV